MKIFKFQDFILEKLGVSEETLKYSDILMKYVKEKFQDFYSNDVSKFEEKLEFEEEIALAVTDKYPITKIELLVTFDKISNEEFTNRFPTISSRGKHFTTTGACEDFEETEDGKSLLKIEVSGIINEDKFDDVDGLEIELESGLIHELNHSFEGYNRYKKGKPVIPTSVTYALDINAADVTDSVWNIWWKEFGYYIYWTERHELNAMTQDAYPYTNKYSFDEMKRKSPSWDFYQRLSSFDPVLFKQTLVDEIKKSMPGRDPEEVLIEMKDGLADNIRKFLDGEENGPDTSIDPILIKKLSVDDFFKYFDKRIKKGAEILRRGIIRHYAR